MSQVARRIAADADTVYAALLDPAAVAAWRVPDGMRAEVHELDARLDGRFRVSLTYDDPAAEGKSHGRTDTYSGRYVALEPGRRVVEVLAFETDRPEMAGEMTVTTQLTPVGSGTQVTMTFTGLPPGVDVRENEIGTAMALDRLARLLEDESD